MLLIIRPICAKTFVAKEANKLSMLVKIGIRFHHAEITYFEIKDYMLKSNRFQKQIICEGIYF